MVDHLQVLSTPVSAAPLPRGFTPLGTQAPTPTAAPSDGIPQTIGELGELLSYTYDLTATSAAQLGIPVAGSVQGGSERRVVVYEWTRYKGLVDGSGVEYRYGFVIRFCLTVSKWDAQAKVSLPFLSAQAQMGQIQASWMMQVRGLVGSKINEVVLPPQELDVETFVLAKQSLDKAIKAIDDPTTRFIPGIILGKTDPAQPDTVYSSAAVRAFAASSVARGRSRAEAISRLANRNDSAIDIITETYDFFGVGDPTAKPDEQARQHAQSVMRGIKADT